MDIKENYEALYNMHLPIQPAPFYYPLDPMTPYPVPPCYAMEINGARRKNATRETTSTLKTWLNEHRKNPYPTKGEKIMLAICTKMSLTQVSTWFANARRRLKKENKMTWSPRNRCDDDDDFIDDEPLANSANDKCSTRSESVSSVQQQNNMLQQRNEQTPNHHTNSNQSSTANNNQHSSSSATNLNDITHPVVPFGLPGLQNGLSNGLSGLPGLPNGLANSSALAQQQIAAAIAAANQLPPQLAQLTPQQLLASDPNSMAMFMQQQLAALHQQQQQHLQQLNNLNNIKKIEEDSSEIVDIEDNSNLGSLSDSDSINPSSAINQRQQQFNQMTTGLSNLPPTPNHNSNHHHLHQSHVNNQQSTIQNHKTPTPLSHHQQSISKSVASLLHQSQTPLNHLSSLSNHLSNQEYAAACSAAFNLAASSLSNRLLSPVSKLTQASLNHKPAHKIWSINSIVESANTNSNAANLLESSHSSKENIKSEKKNENSSPVLKVPSVNPPSTTGLPISISSPCTTSIPSTLTNTLSASIKKE